MTRTTFWFEEFVETLIEFDAHRFAVTWIDGERSSKLWLGKTEHNGYLRETQTAWADWARVYVTDRPSFNWVAVRNFNRSGTVLVLHNGAVAEALLQLHEHRIVACDGSPRADLVYVSFLEVAPWNRASATTRRFRGLGGLLLAVACDRAFQLDMDGHVGLHATQPAEEFYRNLGFEEHDCPNEHNEIFLEIEGDVARRLISKARS